MQQIVRKGGGEREKARQIRRPRRVGRAMSVCTLAGNSAIPAAIGARAHTYTCEQIVKAFLLTLLCCHFCFGSGVSPSGAKTHSRHFPEKGNSIRPGVRLHRLEAGKGAPLHLHFNYLRNGILEQQTPPLLFLPSPTFHGG